MHPDERQREAHGGVQAGDMDAKYVDVVSKGSGVEVQVDHTLGRRPYGGEPVASGGRILYHADGMTTPYRSRPWTDKFCYFVPLEATGARWRIRIY